MYDLGVCIPRPTDLVGFLSDTTLGCSSFTLKNISTVAQYFEPSHFDIRPRSSIGKTPFRLANAVGTIDKTYCGIESTWSDGVHWFGDTLGCYLDYHPQLGKQSGKRVITAGDRLLQVVAPALDDILHIRLDFTEEHCQFWGEVIGNKQRSGFGSTN
jgi:dUTPase